MPKHWDSTTISADSLPEFVWRTYGVVTNSYTSFDVNCVVIAILVNWPFENKRYKNTRNVCSGVQEPFKGYLSVEFTVRIPLP